MFKNYLKVSLRYFLRNRMFVIINITGLTIGLTCCLLLLLYVIDENSYDKHQGNDVYRLNSFMAQKEGDVFSIATSSVPIGPVIQMEIPEISDASRVLALSIVGDKSIVRQEENIFQLEDGFIADSAFFRVLLYDFLEGEPGAALKEGGNIVLRKDLSVKLFGEKEATGKMVHLKTAMGEGDFVVTGVFDVKNNPTHFNPSFIVPMHNALWAEFIAGMDSWVINNLVYTYVRLHHGTDPVVVEGKIDELFLKNGKEELAAMGISKHMELEPVQEIHFNTTLVANIPGNTSKLYVRVITAIGVLVLLLACVNYINLSTAQGGRRSREVGVRKAMGASPFALSRQFLLESFLLVLFSVLMSVLLAQVTLPYFNLLLGSSVVIDINQVGKIGLLLALFLMVTSLLAGSYPAFILSRFDPIKALKGRRVDSGNFGLGKKVFVIFQFVISVALITSIIIISDQFRYIRNKEKGFNSSNKIVIPITGEKDQKKYDVLKNGIKSIPNVKDVTGTTFVPGEYIVSDMPLYKQGESMENAVVVYRTRVDYNWLEMMEIDLINGRNFHVDSKADMGNRVLVNRVLTSLLGFTPEEIVGENLFFDYDGEQYRFEVIGVMEDIHHMSLHNEMKGMLYQLDSSRMFNKVVVDIDQADYPTVLEEIKKVWKAQIPDSPFESEWLDGYMYKLYE
ncbi:MAG: ABC transporter permease, partial [Cyclobacteriaceae bacterium]|nr:ABC transporter permease [Cyclobacteriaceae bacterium]